MAFTAKEIETEFDAAVDGAVSFVDLVDKFSAAAAKYAAFIPGAGPEIAEFAPLIDDADKALHALQSALNA